MGWLSWCLGLSLCALSSAWLASCGAGSAAGFSAAGSDSENTPASVVAVSVASTKSAPLIVRFSLTDANGDDARARLEFAHDDGGGPGPFQDMTLTTGRVGQKTGAGAGGAEFDETLVDVNLSALSASESGVEHVRLWDWPADLFPGQAPNSFGQFPTQVGFVVRVSSVLGDPGSFQVVSTQSLSGVTLGNHAPAILQDGDTPSLPRSSDEVAGIVGGALEVGDESVELDPNLSLEQVDVSVQYAVVDELPDAQIELIDDSDWNDIIPVGDDAPPSGFTFEGVPLSSGASGAKVSFAWDVEKHVLLSDPTSALHLQDQRREVALRLRVRERNDIEVGEFVVLETPTNADPEPVVFAETFFGPRFVVDNNDAPIATLGAGAFSLNPDQRRGIPVPFRVADGESQDARVVLQWKRGNEPGYQQLPSSFEDVQAILEDPEQRRALQICTELPRRFEGSLWPGSDPSEALLPSLLAGNYGVHHPPLADGSSGVLGEQLHLLRPFRQLRAIKASWTSAGAAQLELPVDVVAVGDGREVLVLEDLQGETWRLQRLQLASGALVQTLGPFSGGVPGALDLSPDGASVLVGTSSLNTVRLTRVDLSGGQAGVAQVLGAPADLDLGVPAAVRGLVALSTDEAVLVAGDALVNVCPAVSSVLLSGLQTPAGLVADPLAPRRLYLSERDWQGTGRISKVDLDQLSLQPVESAGLVGPTSLALERDRAILLVVAQNQVHALQLESEGAQSRPISPPFGGELGGVATGPDGLRLLAWKSAADLGVGGGVEQRREIISWDAPSGALGVGQAFDPPLSRSEPMRYRIDRFVQGRSLPSSPAGQPAVEYQFVWDSRDVPEGGEVNLLLVPFDSVDGQLGISSGSGANRSILGELNTGLQVIPAGTVASPAEPGYSPITRVRAADVNGDGASDLLVGFRRANEVGFTTGGVALLVRNTSSLVSGFAFSSSQNSFLLGNVGGAVSTLDDVVDLDSGDLNGDGAIDVVGLFEGTTQVGPPELQVGQGIGVWLGAPAGFTSPVVPEPSSEEVSTAGSFPSGLRLADLDGDGVPEIVSSDRDGASILVHRYDGGAIDLEPGSPITHPELTEPEDVATSDVNCDGFLDLIAPSKLGKGSVLVFLRDPLAGGLHFTPPASALGPLSNFSSNDEPVALDIGDIDNDGSPDIVTANAGSRSLGVLVQDPSSPGGFAGAISVGGAEGFALSAPLDVQVADTDGDGRSDLTTANGVRISVFTQRRGGAFDPSVAFADPALHVSLVVPGTSVDVADLDGDGDADLVGSVNLEFNGVTQISGVALFEQANFGQFQVTSSQLLQSPQLQTPATVDTGDIDGDGDRDLVASFAEFGALLPQSSPSVFVSGPEVIIALDTPPEFGVQVEGLTKDVRAAFFADVNSDGLPDVVTANRVGNNLGLFFQAPNGEFGAAGAIGQRVADLSLGDGAIPSQGGAPVRALAGDLDADGRTDLAAALAGLSSEDTGLPFSLPARIYVFLQEASPASPAEPFVYADRLRFPATAGEAPDEFDAPADMLLADLVDAQGMPEPDGLLEVVTANGGLANTVTAVGVTGGPLPVLSKLGLLDFASAVPASLGAGDLDGDGRQDLLVASAGKLDVFLEFTQQPSSTLLVSNFGDPSSVELGDLDLDGDLDVIIPDEEASLVQVFYQTVDGVLQLDTSSAISAVLGPRHVNLSDLDGDGELDISVVNEGAVIGEGLGIFFGGH